MSKTKLLSMFIVAVVIFAVYSSTQGADPLPQQQANPKPTQKPASAQQAPSAKSTYTMKVVEPGKARDLKIGEDNLIEVEVKEGSAPIADGVEIQAIIDENEKAFLEDTGINKATTRNGVATFHLKPKDVNGTAIIRFQLKDSFTELKVNISQLSFYQAIVEKTVNQLLGYIAILAAIGTVSMGLLEAIKWNDFIKGKTQGLFFRRYLKTTTADVRAIAENIIEAAYGRCGTLGKKLFFRQSPEEIIKQTKAACSDVIKGVETDKPELQKFIDEACSQNTSAKDQTKEPERRIENLNTYFDAVLVEMNARWKFWNQVAATVISVLIIGCSLSFFYSSVSSVKVFALSFFGGLLAPMAKDFTNSVSSIISKLKGA